MMEAFLRTLLNMSLTGSLAILAVLLLRLALKGLPKIYSYALWTVVLFRLLCPVSVESHFSLLGALDVPVTESGSINFLPQQSQDSTAGELPPGPQNGSDRSAARTAGQRIVLHAPLKGHDPHLILPYPGVQIGIDTLGIFRGMAQFQRHRPQLLGHIPGQFR